MSQEPDDAARRVVKKVVKKTVVRPLAPTQPTSAESTQRTEQPAGASSSTRPRSPRRLRSARLATPTRVPAARPAPQPTPQPTPAIATPAPVAPAARVATPPPAVTPTPPTPAPAAQAASAAPTITSPPAPDARESKPGKPARPKKPKKPAKQPKQKHAKEPKPKRNGPGLGSRLADVRYAITDRIRDGFGWVGDVIADSWHWLISLRLPHVSPARGSAITGILVGLLSVTFGWGFYQLFSFVRGTQAGGGWGFLALVFVAFVAFIAGELLLSGFGVPLARVISILSILVVLLLVLVFFIKLAAGVWAWLLIPALSALSFMASNTVMQIASQEQNDQRLPWEPTDESQVNLD